MKVNLKLMNYQKDYFENGRQTINHFHCGIKEKLTIKDLKVH